MLSSISPRCTHRTAPHYALASGFHQTRRRRYRVVGGIGTAVRCEALFARKYHPIVYGRAMRSNARAVWVTEDLSPVAEDI